jgi:GDP-4-dehydro-6-deoxy-D-mannose reductase
MRILVTGITGFAGGHLAEALLSRPDVELFGLSRQTRWPSTWKHLAGRAVLLNCDVADNLAVESVLREIRPESIYHLAGYAHVGRSFQETEAAWTGNLIGTRSLYDAVLRWGAQPRILFVGSAMIYGDPERPGEAFDERCVLRPTSPYGSSKAAADLVSYQYYHAQGLPIVRARPFNHIGPAQSAEFAVAHFAKQVAAISLGLKPPILETGNLDPRRDVTDVRDMVRAYLALMEKGRPGEAYNIGIGHTVSMREILGILIKLAGVQAEIRQRSDLVRSQENAVVHANATKVHEETGWRPAYSLEQTLKDTLDYWHSLLASGS